MLDHNPSLEFAKQRLLKLEPKHYSLCKLEKLNESKFLIAFFSLNLELSIIPVSSPDISIRAAKFKWWENELNNIFSNSKLNHPLITLLHEVKEENALTQDLFTHILKSRNRDYSNQKFANFTEIEKYIDQIHFVIFQQFLSCFNYSTTKSEIALLKKILHAQKGKNISKSLLTRGYNNHPFIPQDLIKKLQSTASFMREKKAKSLIQDYTTKTLKEGQEIKKTNLYKKCKLVRNLYSLS